MKKKKINKKDIPGYAYGASEVTGAVTNGLAATMPYATSGKATVGTALGGMASGAAAGAALGPWGAVAGAAIGGIMGSIGSGGSVDEMTGEITNPSGIAGLFGHSRGYLQRKSNRIKNSNLGRQMTDALRADYYNNSMAEYNPNTFAQGGIVPTTLGWVDDGEFGRNPDGTLFKVPDEGKPTDSNLMQLEVGSQLWSPNLKNPNTGNYFSIDAENIAKKYKTNGTDKYAKTTKSLNDAQMHKELDDLLAVQESVKMKKNKTKGDLPAYEGGKSGEEDLSFWDNQRKRKSILGKWLLDYDAGQEQKRQNIINWFKDFVSNGGEYRFNKGGGLEIKSNGKWYRTKDGSFTEKDRAGATSYSYPGIITPEIAYMFDKSKHNYGINIPERSAVTVDSNILSNINLGISSYDPVKFYGNEKSETSSDTKKTTGSTSKKTPTRRTTSATSVPVPENKLASNINSFNRPLTERKTTPFDISAPSTRTELKTITTPKLNTDYKPSSAKRNRWSGWADALGYVGQLAAPIANIIEGSKDVEPVDPVYMTPTFGRVSIDPRNALRQIRNTQGLTNYNANNLGGAGMAYSLLNALNTNASINDLYGNVYDKEIGLSQFNANIANDAARYNADARRATNESYAQNKAAGQNMKMTGIGQLGQLSGQIPRDIKLNRTNAGLSKAMEKWLAQYMPTADVNDLFKTLNYGR